jgi:hypothetical protein
VTESAPELEPRRACPTAALTCSASTSSPTSSASWSAEWRGRHLACDPDAPPLVLHATDDPLVFDVEPGSRASGEPCRFERGADGRIRSLWIGGGSYWRLHPAV